MSVTDLNTKVIRFGSEEYLRTLHLREEILRLPLGLKLTPEELKRDADDIHLGIFRGENLLGCLILSRTDSAMKMRQVAIKEQGGGLGTKLVRFAEKIMTSEGVHAIELNARETAVEFYEKLGYKTVGDFFTEKTIQHIKMTKEM